MAMSMTNPQDNLNPNLIRRQMPENHDPDNCHICQFLKNPCKNCGKYHAVYEEAAHCMRQSWAAYNQYIAHA